MRYIFYFSLLLSGISFSNSLSSQEWLWAESIYGPDDDEIRAVETDNNGNLYIGGGFKDTLFFSDSVYHIAPSNYYDGFIAKYDSSGNFLWAKTYGGNHNDYILDIDINDSGSVYLACYARSSNTVSYDSFSYTGTGNDKTFILKTDPQGNLIWGNLVTHGISNAIPTSIRAKAGIVALTGTYAYVDLIIGTDTLSHKGGDDAFLAVYSDSSSNLLWTSTMTSQFLDYSRYLDIDDSANIYTSGIFNSTLIIGDSLDTLLNPLGYEVYLIKFSASGVYQWARRYSGSGGTQLDGLELSTAGNIYLSGYIGYGTHQLNDSSFTVTSGDNFYVQKLNTNGNSIWTNIYSGGSLGRILGMATDHLDNVFISGYLGSTYMFDTISLSGSSSNYRSFIIKLSNNGDVLHGKAGGNYTNNTGLDNIAYAGDGSAYLIGYFGSSPGQIAVFGDDSLESYGGRDGFIAKYGSNSSAPCNLTASLSETQNIYCQGDTAGFVNTSTNATNYQWFLNGNFVTNSSDSDIELMQADTNEIMLIANNSNCSDTASLDIYVNPSYTDTLHETICQGDTIHIAQQPFFDQGIYTINLTSTSNCDSTIILDLTVNPVYQEVLYDTICQGDTIHIAQQPFFDQGIYTINLTSTSNCDSTIILDLTVNPVYQEVLYDTICQGDTFFLYDDSIAITQSGVYQEDLLSVHGCDSANAIHLWVDTLNADFDIQGDTAFANPGYAYYQWLNCDSSFKEISGANSNVFIPKQDGNYAVEIATNNCIDTSSCKSIIASNINKISTPGTIRIFPNPVKDYFNIEGLSKNHTYSLNIFSVNSTLIYEKSINKQQSSVNIEAIKPGIYFLVISSDSAPDEYFKFIKL
ncbi:MAG: T9SS type A sorting domain-containing protein [Bacteroidota bacterium]